MMNLRRSTNGGRGTPLPSGGPGSNATAHDFAYFVPATSIGPGSTGDVISPTAAIWPEFAPRRTLRVAYTATCCPGFSLAADTDSFKAIRPFCSTQSKAGLLLTTKSHGTVKKI